MFKYDIIFNGEKVDILDVVYKYRVVSVMFIYQNSKILARFNKHNFKSYTIKRSKTYKIRRSAFKGICNIVDEVSTLVLVNKENGSVVKNNFLQKAVTTNISETEHEALLKRAGVLSAASYVRSIILKDLHQHTTKMPDYMWDFKQVSDEVIRN